MKIYTNQKTQFENGETFRRLSRDSEVIFNKQNLFRSLEWILNYKFHSHVLFQFWLVLTLKTIFRFGYASFLDRPIQERQKRLLEAAREGRAEIVFVNTGIHIRH